MQRRDVVAVPAAWSPARSRQGDQFCHRPNVTSDMNASLVPIWEHTCCGGRITSAAQRCDRCGALSTARVLTPPADWIAPTLTPLTRPPFILQATGATGVRTLQAGPRQVTSRAIREDEGEAVAAAGPARRSSDDLERALVFGLWLLAGIASSLLGLGAAVEFEAGRHLASMVHAVAATAPALGILFMAGDATVRRFSMRWGARPPGQHHEARNGSRGRATGHE